MKKTFEKTKSLLFKTELRKTIMILAVIVILGAGFRLYHLGSNPLIADEFIDMNASYGYFQTHVWQAWDFNKQAVNTTDVYAPRDVRTWIYRWQVAEMFHFFPATEAMARSISVLWGLITIVLMYFVTLSFTKNKKIAFIAALLFSLSITGIEFDRRLRMYAMFYPVYLALSWLVFQFFETQYKGSLKWLKAISQKMDLNPAWIVPLLLVAALSFHLQLLTANLAPVFFVYVLVLAIWSLRKKVLAINKYVTMVGLAIVGIIAGKIIAPGLLGLFLGSLKLFINNSEYLTMIFRDYSQFLLAIIVLAVGTYWLAKEEKKPKETLWLFISFLVPLLMAAFLWKRPQGIQYVFFIQSFLIILMASGIYGIAAFFKRAMPQFKNKAFGAAIVLLFLLLPNYGYFFSNDDTTYHRGNTQVGDYRKVFAYVKKHATPGEFILTRNFRTYYLAGANFDIYDFGGERETSDLSVDTVKQLVASHPSGWIVLFDNDDLFISHQAMDYIQQNLVQTDVSAIRGAAKAWTWGM